MRLVDGSSVRFYRVCDCVTRGDAGFVEVGTTNIGSFTRPFNTLPNLLPGPAWVELEVTPVKPPTTNATDPVSLSWSQKWYYYGLKLQ